MTNARTGASGGELEPEGSEADRLEQASDDAPAAAPQPVAPLDPEVPIADAWEQSLPVPDDPEDERR